MKNLLQLEPKLSLKANWQTIVQSEQIIFTLVIRRSAALVQSEQRNKKSKKTTNFSLSQLKLKPGFALNESF